MHLLSCFLDDLLVDNPLPVTISPGLLVAMNCVPVEANDDVILENDEEYMFTIRTSDSAVFQITPDSGRIIVGDNDRKFMCCTEMADLYESAEKVSK